jgi:hypothetical protein
LTFAKNMKIIKYTITVAMLSLISCDKKGEGPLTAENSVVAEPNVQAVNKFAGEWIQVDGDNTIAFVVQSSSLLFNDGAKNFKAELSSDRSINVDLSSLSLGIVIFEYSQEDDTISAMGDTFRRKQ